MKKHFVYFLGMIGIMIMSCEESGNMLPHKETENVDTMIVVDDVPVAFATIPGTLLSEAKVNDSQSLSVEDFKATSKGHVYAQNIEYICYRESEKVYYIPFSTIEGCLNVFSDIEGRNARCIAFYEDYATAQYETTYDASGEVVLEYHTYIFDEETQHLTTKCVDGWLAKEDQYTVVYADADYIILECEIDDKESDRLTKYGDKNYFVREVLVRHICELESATTILDYRN